MQYLSLIAWVVQNISPWALFVLPAMTLVLIVVWRLFHRSDGTAPPRTEPTLLRTRIIAIVLSFLVAAPMVLMTRSLMLPPEELDSITAFFADTENPQVVILDVSGSVNNSVDGKVVAGMLSIIASLGKDYRVGFIPFATGAVEMWDPDGEVALFTSLEWLFTTTNEKGEVPEKPWAPTIGTGTVLIPALEKALEVLERDGYQRASILLISDLYVTEYGKEPLVDILMDIKESPYDLRIVALETSEENLTFFEAILGEQAVVLEVDKSEFLGLLAEQAAAQNSGEARERERPSRTQPMRIVWFVATAMLLMRLWLPRLPIWSIKTKKDERRR